MREDGSIGIEFNAVVSSIKELMERIDWLHEQFDSPILIEEYVEGREMYVGVLGNETPEALPVIELDLSKLPEGHARIAAAEVKWGEGDEGVPRHEVDCRHGPVRGDHRAAPVDGDFRVSGARAARLRPRRHAAEAGRHGLGHRGESQPVARLARRAGAGGAQSRPHVHPADRGNRRHGDGEIHRDEPRSPGALGALAATTARPRA